VHVIAIPLRKGERPLRIGVISLLDVVAALRIAFAALRVDAAPLRIAVAALRDDGPPLRSDAAANGNHVATLRNSGRFRHRDGAARRMSDVRTQCVAAGCNFIALARRHRASLRETLNAGAAMRR
jgi:hypothetical protein